MLIFLSACVSTPPKEATATPEIKPGVPFSLTEKHTRLVEDGVKLTLKDPNSAMFRGFKASISDKGVVTVCGFVNAKNSFGGYTGYYPFLGVLIGEPNFSGFVGSVSSGEDSDARATITVCERSGIYLTE